MTVAAVSSSPLIIQETTLKTNLIRATTSLGVLSVVVPRMLKSTFEYFESGIADKIPAFSKDSTAYLTSAFMMCELGTILFTTSAANKDLKYDQTGQDFKYRLGQGAAISLAALGAAANGLFFLVDQGYISSENLPEGLTSFGAGVLTSSLALTAVTVKLVNEYMKIQTQTNLSAKEFENFSKFAVSHKEKSKEERDVECLSYCKALSPSQQENLMAAVKKLGFICTPLSIAMKESGAF